MDLTSMSIFMGMFFSCLNVLPTASAEPIALVHLEVPLP